MLNINAQKQLDKLCKRDDTRIMKMHSDYQVVLTELLFGGARG